MKKLLLLAVCCFWTQNANALCDNHPIKMNIEMEPGEVVYHHNLSRKEFARFAGGSLSPNTLGLTVAKSQLRMSGKPYIAQEKNGRLCVGLDEVNFYIGYDKIDVYIDKKYKKNSCNYKVIKDHENYHVGVFQQAMTFFRPDIERELKEAVADIRPEYAYSTERAEQIMNKLFERIRRRIQPVLNHIDKKIAEKNNAIDTPESYRKTTARCPKW